MFNNIEYHLAEREMLFRQSPERFVACPILVLLGTYPFRNPLQSIENIKELKLNPIVLLQTTSTPGDPLHAPHSIQDVAI
jgi:hypothetical protein